MKLKFSCEEIEAIVRNYVATNTIKEGGNITIKCEWKNGLNPDGLIFEVDNV